MSKLHIGVIKSFLEKNFAPLIDQSDIKDRPQGEKDQNILSRSLAAFAISHLGNVPPDVAVRYVTDGYGDNGIDAVYRDPDQRITFLVQSKWDSDGNGSVDLGDVHKFLKGFNDFLEGSSDRFNVRMQKLWPQVSKILHSTGERLYLVLIYSGSQPIAKPQADAIGDELKEVNDPTELVLFKPISQGEIYEALDKLNKGSSINVDISLTNWGQVTEPFLCFYGRISTLELAKLYRSHGPNLFTKNIRFYRGETEVNQQIAEAATKTPANFIYYNNGVTILCDKIDKKPIGSGSRDVGIFSCTGISVVNGAQTVGTLGLLSPDKDETLEQASAFLKIVSLQAAPAELANQITKAANTQNRIEARDFVSLDELQRHLQLALSVSHGISYSFKASEEDQSDPKSVDFSEAATALACAHEDVSHSVQAKREVGKLWEDTGKAPYTILFNRGLSEIKLLNAVMVVREVRKSLETAKWTGKQNGVSVHGNRFIAHRVFQWLRKNGVSVDKECLDLSKLAIDGLVKQEVSAVEVATGALFGTSYLHSLFKNKSKCDSMNQHLGTPKN